MKFLDRFKRKAQPETPADPASAGSGSSAPIGPTIVKDGNDIVIALGEFLHRIPPNLLEVGPHDLKKEIRFDMQALADRINGGDTALNLAEVYRQIPQIFRSEIREADNLQLLYPWRKVIAVINEGRPAVVTESPSTYEPKPQPPSPPVEVKAPAAPVAAQPTPAAPAVPNASEDLDWDEIEAIAKSSAPPRAQSSAEPGNAGTSAGDPRLAAVIAERDALIQQKAHLAGQLTALRKRSMGSPYRPSESPGQSAVHQRQIEEFQRRITLMESKQRETALELTREKEARAKAEKLLIAAEKLQEQSANYMESAKAEMRREVEASMRPREAESRKAQKDLQEQIFQLTEENRKLLLELELARANEGSGSSDADGISHAFHDQAIAQLQADIETYRDRLKTLLKERDEARAEARAFANKEVNLGSTLLSSDELANLREELEAVTSRNAELLAELDDARAKLDAEKGATAARLRDDTCALEQQLANAIHAREELAEANTKLLHDAQADLAERDQLLAALEKDHTTALQEKDALIRKLATLEQERERAKKQSGPKEPDAMLGDPALQAEASALRAALNAAEEKQKDADRQIAELKAALKRDRDDLDATLNDAKNSAERAQVAASEASSELDLRRREFTSLQAERDVLAQQRDELLRRITNITEEHKRLMEKLSTDPHVLPRPGLDEEPPMNVIEVPLPEVLPPEPGTGVKVPKARPVAVPPPRIRTL